MKTMMDRQLGAAITVRPTLRAGTVDGGIIIIVREKTRLP